MSLSSIHSIHGEPTVLTEIILQYLSLEQMIAFIESPDENIHAIELHKANEPNGDRSLFERTLKDHFQNILTTLRKNKVRLIENDGDEPHVIIARTIQEQIREIKSLLNSQKLLFEYKRKLLNLIEKMVPTVINPSVENQMNIQWKKFSDIEFTHRSAADLLEAELLLEQINTWLAWTKISKPSGFYEDTIPLSGFGLTRLSKETIEKLKNKRATSLWLTNNELTRVENIGTLTTLQELFLSDNQISSLKGISSLTTLLELFLNNNQFSSLTGIGSLTGLEKLYLASNHLSSVKELAPLTEIRELSLSKNQLTSVKGIGSLRALKELRLTHNKITSIEEIQHLSLSVLELEGNPIEKVSESCRQLLEGTGDLLKRIVPSPTFLPLRSLKSSSSLPSVELHDEQPSARQEAHRSFQQLKF